MLKERAQEFLRPPYRRIKYGGRARQCPICGHGARMFRDCGIVRRPDARCPFCESLERHRLFWLFLQRKTDFFTRPPERFLHVAPEPVLEKKFRKLLGEGYVTSDLFDPHVDEKMDVTNIHHPDDTFDFIYCSHVLEHVPDDRKAMREFRRVLTEHGRAIILVPITAEKTFEDPAIQDPAERLRLFGQEDHVRRYGPDYIDSLREEGLTVTRYSAEDFLTPEERETMGITSASGDIYLSTKAKATAASF